MGKGQIVSHIGAGRYNVSLTFAYRNRVVAKIAAFDVQIAQLQARLNTLDVQIAAEADLKKKEALINERSAVRLQKTSAEKLRGYYQDNMPADPTVMAWCMDLTEDLSGSVGTAEIPGERQTVLIRPGHGNQAVYSTIRDGQIMPSIAGEPNQVLFNWMMLPGWQRHRPIYRIGTIVEIDYDLNTCTVCLDPAYSSQLSLPAVDGLQIGDCGATSDYTAQINDFCLRNPNHPFCTNTDEGSPINLSSAQLAQLQQVNGFVNANYGRENDKSGFAIGDKWDVMETGGQGDCEDFALTKMKSLVDDYGWDPRNLKIIGAKTQNGEGHAMLGVVTSNRGLVLLDVNYDQVMESARLPYRIDQIAMTKNSWKHYTRKLEAVPIQYMQCNAAAFAEGDRVVVEFPTKEWTNSKVVGFVTDPQPCTMDALILGNDSEGPNDWSLFRYLYDSDSWLGGHEIPGHEYGDFITRNFMFGTAEDNAAYIFGGLDGTQGIEHIYNRADKYTAGSGTWAVLSDMPFGRAYGQGFRTGSKHYCVSGSTWKGLVPGGGTTDQNYEYDRLANSWAIKADHPVGRMYSAAFQIGSIGFSFGGSTIPPTIGSPYILPDSFYGFNPDTNIWSAHQSMSRGRMNLAAGNLNGEGYIFDGFTYSGHSGDHEISLGGFPGFATRWVEKFNLAANSWAYVTQSLGSGDWGHASGIAESVSYGLGFLGIGASQNWAEYNALTNVAIEKTEVLNRFSALWSCTILAAR